MAYSLDEKWGQDGQFDYLDPILRPGIRFVNASHCLSWLAADRADSETQRGAYRVREE